MDFYQNAKIVLDEFTVRLHSPDTIAPVGVLHATEFHLEYKSIEPNPGLPGTLLDVTNDFVTNNGICETHAAIPQSSVKCIGSMPCPEASIKSELRTDIIRQRQGFVAIRCWRKVDLPHEGKFSTRCAALWSLPLFKVGNEQVSKYL